MSKLNNTVQDVTQKIIDVMSSHTFPQVPFVTKGYFEEKMRNIEALESDVFYYWEKIEVWYIDRKQRLWIFKDSEFPQYIMKNLRSNRIRKYPFVSLVGRAKLSTKYYEVLVESYIKKLSVVKWVLLKWLKFLFLLEDNLFIRSGIHTSLKVFK